MEMQDFMRSCKATVIHIFKIQLIVAQLGNILGVIVLQHEMHGHNVFVCFTTIRVGRCIVSFATAISSTMAVSTKLAPAHSMATSLLFALS